MLSPLLILLPLLATSSAQPHNSHAHANLNARSPAHAKHAALARAEAQDQPPQPLGIFNNALLGARSEPKVQEGLRLVKRKKKRSCGVKTPPGQAPVAAAPGSTSTSTSMIGQGAYATSGPGTSPTPAATPAPSVSASASQDEAWYYYTSAWSSASSAAAAGGSAVSSPSAASTSSSSSTVPAPSPSTGSGGGGGGSKNSMLFPLGRGMASWSSNVEESGAMSISDALKPLSAGKLPTEGSAPDGSSALIASFPAGTVKLASGQGFSFYTEGSKSGVSCPSAKEVVFSYSAFFEEGFQFARGGKMPGLFGGTSFETAKSCSGGKQDGRGECFSARLMWRSDGMGEAYNYYPTSVTQGNNYCGIGPKSVCDPNFGDSIGRGSFYWTAGQWTTVAQRLKLNDVGQSNGEQEIFVNGKSVLHLTGLQISVNAETKIYGIMAQTFFGGSDSSWASPRDQNIWFKDFSMAVIA